MTERDVCHCGFPLRYWQTTSLAPGDPAEVERAAISFQSAGSVMEVSSESVAVVGRATEGPSAVSMRSVRHRELAEHHAALVRGNDDLFVVALDGAVFVDGRLSRSRRLEEGDVLQCGPLAW
ncbi:MAG: hypothetical protein AAFU85_14195, partial [Planctomycetota bacterium]